MRPQDYEAYCRADPAFYDDPVRGEESRDPQDPQDPEVIGEVLAYCREHRLSVKFLRGPVTVLAANSKYAPRASRGKLLTLYPRDEAELRRALTGLAARPDGRRGPYILSDLRWRDTVLYVRALRRVPADVLRQRGR
ncbi:hypothetical protein [Streptomyces sp. PsTaAH-124]|uniref:class III lanthionine synthetase LanKC N-terminal domain-containing protein n=1 Tax=Streptomyces sp. PsTaAH-124 TaxID=1157638 RepID=UPI00039CF479|nr:hypothetical protein [Streptomyces sp. PsTaAH-124]